VPTLHKGQVTCEQGGSKLRAHRWVTGLQAQVPCRNGAKAQSPVHNVWRNLDSGRVNNLLFSPVPAHAPDSGQREGFMPTFKSSRSSRAATGIGWSSSATVLDCLNFFRQISTEPIQRVALFLSSLLLFCNFLDPLTSFQFGIFCIHIL